MGHECQGKNWSFGCMFCPKPFCHPRSLFAACGVFTWTLRDSEVWCFHIRRQFGWEWHVQSMWARLHGPWAYSDDFPGGEVHRDNPDRNVGPAILTPGRWLCRVCELGSLNAVFKQLEMGRIQIELALSLPHLRLRTMHFICFVLVWFGLDWGQNKFRNLEFQWPTTSQVLAIVRFAPRPLARLDAGLSEKLLAAQVSDLSDIVLFKSPRQGWPKPFFCSSKTKAWQHGFFKYKKCSKNHVGQQRVLANQMPNQENYVITWLKNRMCSEIKGVLMRVVQYYTTKIKINHLLTACIFGDIFWWFFVPYISLGKKHFLNNREQTFLKTRILKQCFKTWPSLPGFFCCQFVGFRKLARFSSNKTICPAFCLGNPHISEVSWRRT